MSTIAFRKWYERESEMGQLQWSDNDRNINFQWCHFICTDVYTATRRWQEEREKSEARKGWIERWWCTHTHSDRWWCVTLAYFTCGSCQRIYTLHLWLIQEDQKKDQVWRNDASRQGDTRLGGSQVVSLQRKVHQFNESTFLPLQPHDKTHEWG